MDSNESRRRKKGKARERQAARLRRQNIASRSQSERGGRTHISPRLSLPGIGNQQWLASLIQNVKYHGRTFLSDIWWYLRRNPIIIRGAGLIVFIVLVLYFLSYLFSGRILPNVHSLGVDLGGMSSREAEDALLAAWHSGFEIELMVEGEVVGTVSPNLLGMRFDAEATAREARGGGLKAVPFGREITPVVEVDHLTAQNYLLDLALQVNIPPYSAGYEIRDGQLVGIEGRYGRALDVPFTLGKIKQNPGELISRGRLELLMLPLEPEVVDPSPYLDDVMILISQQPQFIGYDPYTNQSFIWPVAVEEYISWLEAGQDSLTLRESEFKSFLEAMNVSLNPEGRTMDNLEAGENFRYLSPPETTNLIRTAIANNKSSVNLRVRYSSTTYEVVRGDTGFRIGRKTGIPFNLIAEENSGRDLEYLSLNDIINIPSRDFMMPYIPVPHKRIVVDLETRYLVAYEYGQIVFEWPISSGVENAPTSPGVYQITDHSEIAYGSSNILCNNAGLECGQWEMTWFMSIYEIQEGLANGFHGKVLLPNGGFLGDSQIGVQVTFGCIMSGEEEARLLYDWAEDGTVVEILSHEYAPMSDLGQATLNRIAAGALGS